MSLRAERSNLLTLVARVHRDWLAAVFLAMTAAWLPHPAVAAEQHCTPAEVVLWGDGRHDDSVALNAWLAGRSAVWADSGAAVGTAIAGRDFRLSGPVYVRAGTGRQLASFRMIWPNRGEVVQGGSIAAGSDPDTPPVVSGVSITGGDAGEGVPFETPDAETSGLGHDDQASCATS